MHDPNINEPTIIIKSANNSHIDSIRYLFYETITNVNIHDYNNVQITAWASGYKNVENWKEKLAEQQFIVAELGTDVVGFGSLAKDGCIDYIYIHKDFQRKGIATKLYKTLETFALKKGITELWTDSSLTARPFFLAMGFIVTKIYTKKAKSTEFLNTIMTKKIQISEIQLNQKK